MRPRSISRSCVRLARFAAIPVHIRHRDRGHRILRNHRLPDRGQISPGRFQHHPGRGNRRSRAGCQGLPARQVAYCGYGCADARRRGIRFHPALPLHRPARPARPLRWYWKTFRRPTGATMACQGAGALRPVPGRYGLLQRPPGNRPLHGPQDRRRIHLPDIFLTAAPTQSTCPT